MQILFKKISKGLNNSNLDENSYRTALQVHRHLHHPDILSLLSTFESPSAFYEILEYCPHGSLSEWMSNSNGPHGSTMTEPQLRGVLQPLIKALLHMHQDKFLHLNVNPSNIFVTSECRVVSNCTWPITSYLTNPHPLETRWLLLLS
jgi:serine/threonine protein kinase